MRIDQNWSAFTVPDTPVPKPVGPRSSKAARAWKRYDAWKKLVGFTANPFFQEPIAGAVALSAVFYLPASLAIMDSDRQRRAVIDGVVTPIGKPDLKNLVAALEDALTGIAWADDAQVVCYGFLEKRWCTDVEPARAFVVVERLPEGFARPRQYTGYPLRAQLEPEQTLDHVT